MVLPGLSGPVAGTLFRKAVNMAALCCATNRWAATTQGSTNRLPPHSVPCSIAQQPCFLRLKVASANSDVTAYPMLVFTPGLITSALGTHPYTGLLS